MNSRQLRAFVTCGVLYAGTQRFWNVGESQYVEPSRVVLRCEGTGVLLRERGDLPRQCVKLKSGRRQDVLKRCFL